MSPYRKLRLDRLMVDRGLVESREKAQALILAGQVVLPGRSRLGGLTAGMLIAGDEEVLLKAGPRFVSRGGEKLQHALEKFAVDPSDMIVLDVGASTGGFTDCLLQAGSAKVYAVDTGRGQIHSRLLADPRVVNIEKVNARHPFTLPEKVDLVVIDVSFISLRLVLGPSVEHLKPGGKVIVLVKPQFEAEAVEVARGGVITDVQLHAAVIGRVVRWAVDREIRVRGLTVSPLLGDKGNREFLLLFEPPVRDS